MRDYPSKEEYQGTIHCRIDIERVYIGTPDKGGIAKLQNEWIYE
jgi:hypothetical protein